MKRTITSIFTVLLALVMVLSLAACGGNSAKEENYLNNQLIGKWETTSGEKIEFFQDGSCIFPSTYNTPCSDHQLFSVKENNSIIFSFYGTGLGTIGYQTLVYKIEEDKLTIDDVEYIKKQ